MFFMTGYKTSNFKISLSLIAHFQLFICSLLEANSLMNGQNDG